MDDQRIIELVEQWLIIELVEQWLNGNREVVTLEILALANPAIVTAKIVRKLCRMSFDDADRFIKNLEKITE